MRDAARARDLHAAGQLPAAETAYRQALLSSPADLALRRDFAVLLMQSGRQSDAIHLIDQPDVVAIADTDLLCILALCLRANGRHARVLQIAHQATIRDPYHALGWMLLGSATVSSGAPAAALAPLQRALALEPEFGEAWHFLGESFQALRRWDDAIQAYRRAATQQPGEVLNIALCHVLAGRTEAALGDLEAAYRMMPGRADILAQLAHCQAMLALYDRQHDNTCALRAVLAGMHGGHADPDPFLLATLALPESLKADAIGRYSRAIAARHVASPPLPAAAPHPGSTRRIRIGYLSADFGEHAVGSLVRDHFAAHDRVRFEVLGYALTAEPPATALVRGFDQFVDASALDDDALAARIAQDRVDVLIDMAGFTLGARPGVLCRRPAPLQWGWLGFIHGQQAPWLDGLLLDAHIQPTDAQWQYEDNIIRLPGTLFPAAPMRRGNRDRDRFGLPNDGVVLASFNNTYKLSASVLRSWSLILAGAPDAHLMVYVPLAARAGFLEQWEACGGSVERLHLVDKVDLETQSDRAASCDLFLDAFQYQAGATAIHAIGNDLPVLSIEGDTPLARLGAGINRFLGMDELVCRDVDDYILRAIQLAQSPAALDALRQRLRTQAEERDLFAPRRSAAAIEAAILQHLVG